MIVRVFLFIKALLHLCFSAYVFPPLSTWGRRKGWALLAKILTNVYISLTSTYMVKFDVFHLRIWIHVDISHVHVFMFPLADIEFLPRFPNFTHKGSSIFNLIVSHLQSHCTVQDVVLHHLLEETHQSVVGSGGSTADQWVTDVVAESLYKRDVEM